MESKGILSFNQLEQCCNCVYCGTLLALRIINAEAMIKPLHYEYKNIFFV